MGAYSFIYKGICVQLDYVNYLTLLNINQLSIEPYSMCS